MNYYRDLTWRIYIADPTLAKAKDYPLVGTVRAATQEEAQEHARRGHWHWRGPVQEQIDHEFFTLEGNLRAWI